MSQKHTLNSLALAAVLALAVFVVAFALFVFLADYRIIGSIFMAFMIALFAGIVLFLGFGTQNGQPVQAVSRAAPSPQPAPAPTAPPAAAETSVSQADAEAEAAKLKEAEDAAAEAARAKAEADAEAARQAAEAEAAAAETTTPDHDGDGAREGSEEGTRPAGLDAPRDEAADDLKQIKGIGPKLEKLCNSLGFWHFDQIAAWTSEEVAWVDANLEGFKGRVTRDKWVEQAKVLASGGETEFSKRVEDGDVY